MDRRKFLTTSGRIAAFAAASKLGFAQEQRATKAGGPLRVHPRNPRYFRDANGQAILLVGSHTWNNLVDMGRGDPPEAFDFAAYLDFLERYGHNPLFMDPYDGEVPGKRFDPQWEPIRRNLGIVRRLSERIDLDAMTPHDELASTKYCLAEPGAVYLVYVPGGGEVTLDLSAATGRFATEWTDCTSGQSREAEATDGGAHRQFRSPVATDAVLMLKRST